MSSIGFNTSGIPGDLSFPLVGQTLNLYFEREKFFVAQYERYGSIFRISFFGRQVAVLVGPEANELVLRNRTNTFSIREGWFFLEPLLGGGLLLQEGADHHRSRRLMFPAFNGEALVDYTNIISNTIDQHLQHWQSQGSLLNQRVEFHRLTLAIACQLILGAEDKQDIKQLSDWFTCLFAGLESVIQFEIPMTSFGIAKESRRKIEEFILSKIKEIRTEQSGIKNNVLSLLMTASDEAGEGLSDQEIVNHVIQLLFAGHETTSKFMQWCLFCLSLYPEWVIRIKKEIIQLEGYSILDRFKRQINLSYFLMEVERLYGPTFMIPRGVTQEFEYHGYKIPKGWLVMVSPMLTHMLPTLYPEPKKFDPDRFAPPREEHKQHPFALIGFGGGAHHCLGKELAKLEISLLLSQLIPNYKWLIDPKPRSFSKVDKPHLIEKLLKFSLSSW